MPHAVEAVVGEGKCNAELEEELGGHRKGTESGRDGCRLEVPAQQWGGKVRSSEDVQTTGEDGSRNTVKSTAVPGDLGAVDGKVGRNRAVQTLLGEDLGRVGSVGSGGGRSIYLC